MASHNAGDTELLIALAATLPRQIEMTNNVHEFASGWNDVLAMWTRIGGIVDNMQPAADPDFDNRIKFDRLLLRERDSTKLCGSVAEAIALVRARPTGRITVRGGNGTGKSTLLAALKAEIKTRAYYWPTSDRLAFQFAASAVDDEPEDYFDDETWRPPRSSPSRRASRPASASSSRCRRSLPIRTRRSICSTNGTPISISPTAPPPMRWSKSWRSAPGWWRSRTGTGCEGTAANRQWRIATGE